MGKKYKTGLIILTTILAIVCVTAGLYLYVSRSIDGYYSVAEGDVFTATMKVKKLVPTEKGTVLVLGTFRSGEGVTGGDSVFVKAYREDGRLINASYIDAEDGLEPVDFIAAGEGARVLFADPENKLAAASVYDVTADGKLSGKCTAKAELTENDDEKFFLCGGNGDEILAELKNGTAISLFDAGGEAVLALEISADTNMQGISVIDDNIYIYGSRKSGNMTGFLQVFSDDGTSLYSLTTMEDKTSVVTDVLSAGEEGGLLIFGRFFDDAEYKKQANNAEEGGSELLREIATLSIAGSDGLFGEVLLSDTFAASPWCSYFIIETGADGTLKSQAYPFTAASDFGISEFEMTKNNEFKGFGVSRMAKSSADTEYSASVYPIKSDMTAEPSAMAMLPNFVRSYFTITKDGRLAAYYGIHSEDGTELLRLKTFGSTGEFATEAKKNALASKVVNKLEIFENPRFLVLLVIFSALVITAFMAPDKKDDNY